MDSDCLANTTKTYGIRMWKYWCKAIGTKAYDDDRKADNVAIIRSVWVVLHIVTCLFIIIGNGRTLGFW